MMQEAKARAYDEALETARKINSGEGVAAPPGWTVCEVIFPELRESKDEKIRKELIDFIKSRGGFKQEYIEWLEKQNSNVDNSNKEYWRGYREGKQEILDKCAELEKQGEQNLTLPKWKYKKDNTPLLRDSLILNKYGCVAKSPSGALISDVWVIDYAELAKLPKEEIENQGEQKPTGKMEPKFHKGDWIVDNEYGDTVKILEVNEQWYKVDNFGQIGEMIVEYTDNEYHLWTLQDAWDGSVLVSAVDKPFIFKGFDTKRDDCPIAYGGIVLDDDFMVSWRDTWWTDKVGCKPATKEQRNFLFSRMKEAGYEWDDNKKELRQKPVESRKEIKPNGGVVCEDFTEGDGYYKVNLAYLSKSQVELIESLVNSWQNPTNTVVSDEQIEELRKHSDNVILRNLYYSLKKLKED